MLKRLLLVLSLFVGGTAFAAGVPYIVNGNNTSNNYGYIPLDNNVADCADIPLTWHGETGSGTFTLTADWTPDVCPLYFDPNIANGGADIASNKNIENEFFGMAWAQYGVGPGNGGVYSECNSSSDDVDAQGRFTCRYYNELSGKWSVNNNGLEVSALPTGKSVAINWNLNVPSGVAAAPVPASYNPQTTQLIFMGFYEDPNGPNNVAEMYLAGGITQIGNKKYLRLSSYGEDAAKLIHRNANGECENNIWYAQWGCVKPTVPTAPVLDGWEFEGWYDAAEGGKKLDDNTCIMGDQTYYAHWTQTTFDCPSEFKEHDVTPVTDPNAQCYKWETPQCDQQNGRDPANCTNVKWANCACDGVRYKVFANGTIVPEGGDVAESCTKTEIISAEPIDENHYWDAATQTCPAYDRVSYYCESPTEGTALTTNNARHNYPYTLQSSSIADNCANATNGYEFDKWNCKLKSAPAVVAMQPFAAGSTEQSWPFDGDVDCVVKNKLRDYTVSYKVKQNGSDVTTSWTTVLSALANPTTYNVNTPDTTLNLPTSFGYTFSENWYECNDNDKAAVETIPGNFAQSPKNLELCIDVEDTAYTITYIGCRNDSCSLREDLTDYVVSVGGTVNGIECGDCKTYIPSERDVTFPVDIPPASAEKGCCLLNVPAEKWKVEDRWWFQILAGGERPQVRTTEESRVGGNIEIFTRIRPYYSVIYDCDNGIETDNSSEGHYALENVVVRTNRGSCQVLPGRSFEGWSCVGATVVNGGFKMPYNDVTCTAQWTITKYPLTYRCNNGGVGGTAPAGGQYAAGENITIASDTDKGNCNVPSGRYFTGWSCTDGLTGETTMPGHAVVCDGQWGYDEYSVEYDCKVDDCGESSNSDCQTPVDNATYHYGVSVSTPQPNTCKKPGNRFSGWICSGRSVADGQSFIITGNTKCDAQWGEEIYSLTYNCANGNNAQSGLSGGNHLAESTVEVWGDQGSCQDKPGNTFGGWQCPTVNLITNPEDNSLSFEMPYDDVTCNAVWNPVPYSITYDCKVDGCGTTVNGCQTPVDGDAHYYGDSVPVKQSTCRNPGYKFEGWKCNGSLTQAGDNILVTGDIKCDAQWGEEIYSLTYNCANGNNAQSGLSGGNHLAESTVEVWEDQGSCQDKPGNTFGGWQCPTVNLITNPEDNSISFEMPYDDVTCDAVWNPIPYTITYNCDTEDLTSQTPEDETHYIGDNVSMPQPNTCRKLGYSFKEWQCGTKGNVADGGQFLMPASDLVCIAKWDEVKRLVKYICNNGRSSDNANESHRVGTSVDVWGDNGSCQIPFGKSFGGWQCTGVANWTNEGTKFEMPDNEVVCNAEWDSLKYNITYLGCINGDCSNPKPLNGYVHADQLNYVISSTNPTVFPVAGEETITTRLREENYLFDGIWFELVTGGTSQVRDTSEKRFGGNMTVYTNLIPYYAVAYDCNGGTGSPVDGNSPYLVDTMVQTLSDSECVRTGYTFVNWECGDKLVDAGNKFKLKADTTCVAQWDNNGYKIKYRGGKAGERSVTQTAMSNQSVKYGEEVSLKKNTFAIEGYDFVGWKCVAISDQDDETITQNYTTDGKQRYPIGAYNYVSDMTCTAQWEPRKYNIVYKNASCDGSEGDVVIEDALTYDSSYELSGVPVESTDMTGAQTYVRVPTGYAFSGWAKLITQTEPDYDAEKIDFPWTSDEPWTTEGDLELYALCYRVPYKIEYDCDATVCDVTTDPKHCTAPIDNPDGHYYNRLVKLKANTCSQPGYTFNSWECAAKSISEEARAENLLEINAEGRIRMPNDDVLCRAKWDRNIYHVTYDCNTDVCDDAESDCVTPYDYEENVGENEEPMLKDYYYNDTVTTKANTCTKTGHKFTKWLCGEEQIAQGGTFNIYNDTTCSAQWEPKHYDINYYSGNCEGEQSEFVDTDANGLEYGQKFSAIKNIGESAGDIDIEVKSGYKFIGWDTAVVDEETASSESFVPGYVSGKEYGPWMTDDNLTLHAVCVPELYHIYYEHNGGHFNPKIVDSVIGPYTVKTPVNVQKVFVSITDEKPGANNFYYHVFDGWYTDPGFAEGTKVEYVPWADLIDNPRDVTLYAKWLDAGEIEFYCNVGQIQSDKKPENEMITSPDASFHEFDCGVGDSCVFDMWNCDDGRRVGDYEDIEVLKNGETVTCVMSQTCSYPITYHVSKMTYGDETLEPVDSVYVGDTEIAVTNLTPASYTTGTVVTYPIISLPGCEFRGWYDNENFEGNTVTGTPETTAGEEGYAIDVYGKMVCGVYDECQDPEKAHWLRIGDNENDRVCLYEYQQTHPSIKINKRDGSGGYYYLMLSEDPDMLMHNGSAKKMRVNYNDKTYNVCDKSICPELAQPEP